MRPSILGEPDLATDDEAFLLRLSRVRLPPDLTEAAGQRYMRLALQRLRPRWLAYTGAPSARYAVNGLPWDTRSAGARAVAFAVMNPGRFVSLGRRRTRYAWHAAISRALEYLDTVDPVLASELAFSRAEAPGLRLHSSPDGRVEIRYTPGKNKVAPGPLLPELLAGSSASRG